jgi:CRISPR-associated protein Csh1
MFQRLYDLSQILPSLPAWQRINEGMPPLYDRGLALCFDDQGDWLGVQTVLGNAEVVYRSGPSNGTDLTPCCKLANNTAARLLRAIESLASSGAVSDAQRDWLKNVAASYQANREPLWKEVDAKARQGGIDGKAHRGYVFLAEGDPVHPVHAWPQAKAHLQEQFLGPFAKGGHRAGHCSVCGESKEAVYGNYAVLACYNLDKPGSIAGGFRERQAHRNLPVCADCTFALAEALAFSERHLSSTMAGQSYLVLPYTNDENVRQELQQSLQKKPQLFELGNARDLVADQLDLVEEFSDRGDQLALALVFYEAKHAAWRILAEVQQVLPSRLQALHQAVKHITAAEDLVEPAKDGDRPVLINAGTFRQFASGDTLRAWLVALFEGQPLERRHFLHFLVAKLTAIGRSKPNLLPWMTRHAWGLYRYAVETGLILVKHPKEDAMTADVTPNSPYGRYVDQHPEFFHGPETVVAFLTGCYAATVAYIQYSVRGASPFTKKFVGRLLSRETLRRLYREGHDKLAQYDKLGQEPRPTRPYFSLDLIHSGPSRSRTTRRRPSIRNFFAVIRCKACSRRWVIGGSRGLGATS